MARTKSRLVPLWLGVCLLGGCRLSPWEIERDVCRGVTIVEQLEALSVQEEAYLRDKRTDFRVALMGDPQLRPGSLGAVIERINARDDIAFAIVNGDLTELGLSRELAWACAAMRSSRVPILAVLGNHDSLGFGPILWREALGPWDYAFSFLGTRFVVFNNNQGEHAQAPDLAFIAAAAALSPDEERRHTIAVSHVRTSGTASANAVEINQFLVDRGIRLSLHAHLHAFRLVHHVDLGLVQYVIGDTRGVEYGTISARSDRIRLAQCTPECVEIEP